jgi:protein transport protein SEC13
VNSVAFAPHEYGLVLGCASSDGQVSVVEYRQETNQWTYSSFLAHSVGVNSISFSPHAEGDLMCVTGGCDNLVKVWRRSQPPAQQSQGQGQDWSLVSSLEGHSDWVRSVAWAPLPVVSPTPTPQHLIASCSQDKSLILWQSVPTSSPTSPGTATDLATGALAVAWEKKQVIPFQFPLWRVSWSVTGHLLAVSGATDHVSIYGTDPSTGDWVQVSTQPL